MTCLFCGVKYHKSKNCDKLKTEKARKKHPNSNRFCFSCFVETDVAHGEEKCEVNENCHAWYFAYHHKLFCKEGIKALTPNLFLPKIDQDLLPRFFKHFDMDENHFMLVSSPSANVNFNHIKVMDSFNKRKIMKCLQSDLVVITDSLELDECKSTPVKKLFSFLKSKTIILPPKISICDTVLTANMVLQLLSSNTKNFSMDISNLSFSDIIKNAPNLENISVDGDETNLIFEDSWIKDLIKYKNGKNFKYLRVRLDKVDFIVEDLVEFIKEKCCKTVEMLIWFSLGLLNVDDEDDPQYDRLKNKLEAYFEYHGYGDDDDSSLTIGYEGVDGYETFSLGKIKEPVRVVTPPRRVLKSNKRKEAPPTRIMPTRSATKRNYVY